MYLYTVYVIILFLLHFQDRASTATRTNERTTLVADNVNGDGDDASVASASKCQGEHG